jgi:hypothetical protein
MAEWKKVVVSGSSAALSSLTLDNVLASSSGGTGLSQVAYSNATGGQVIGLKTDKSGLEFKDDSSQFTSTGISGSLGDNADLIRGLTAVDISGSFTSDSASIAANIAALELNGVCTAVGISGSSANKLPLAGGTMAGAIAMGTNNITGVGNLVVGGDLSVAGTASFNHSTNLSVADKYILLNSGSQTTGDGGFVVQQGTNGIGELFGYDKDSGTGGRWGVTTGFNADTSADFTPAAFMSSVVVGSDDTLPTGTYAKKGNIFIGNSVDEVWIYGS